MIIKRKPIKQCDACGTMTKQEGLVILSCKHEEIAIVCLDCIRSVCFDPIDRTITIR